VKIIHKYVLREHAGPFTFALTALTSLLLLNYIAKQFGQLVGKGLPWTVIGEFFVLSLPFTVAMTLPMAVLIAVLYAFSRLAAENEVTALKASGVGMSRLMIPVLLASAVVSAFMVYFNDQVLPAANHRLSILQGDIARKKPTFALREQVINEVAPGQFYIRANDIDEYTSLMRDVTIYDMSDAMRRRTIYADSGTMELAPNGSDLQMTLHHGYMQEVPRNDPTQLQRLYYQTDRIRVANVANNFNRDTSGGIKSDREKTVCELEQEVEAGRRDAALAQRNLTATLVALTREATTGAPAQNALVLPAPSTGNAVPTPRNAEPVVPEPRFDAGRAYCALANRIRQLVEGQPVTVASAGSGWSSLVGVSELHAAELPPRQAAQDTTKRVAQPAQKPEQAPVIHMQSSTVPAPAPGTSQPTPAPQQPAVLPPQDSAAVPPPPGTAIAQPIGPQLGASPVNAAAAIEAARARVVDGRRQMNENAVEIHKKFALSAAVMIFVLLGAPIAIRFPRGGVGFVIGASLVIFAVYYVGLIGGEPLGDRGILPPFFAMWLPNLVPLPVAILFLSRMGREAGTSRGGDMSELFATVRGAIARPFRRRPRAGAAVLRPTTPAGPVDDQGHVA